MKRISTRIILLSLIFVLPILWVQAQDDTTTDTTTSSEPTSTINWFVTVCEERAVVDLNGTMDAGYDIYAQVFEGLTGTGAALSAQRRIPVNGDYTVSVIIPFNANSILATGQFASVTLQIAGENDATDIIFEQVVDDIVDLCNEPSNTTADSIAQGQFAPGEVISSSGVFTPAGDFLNPVTADQPEAIVQIGARPSEFEEPGRTENPGLIFAECDSVTGADPGVLYDVDTIRVYWSWFARTPELVQQHIANAQYSVKINGLALPDPAVSSIVQFAGDPNYWVFFEVNLGDKWRPGQYGVQFELRWTDVTDDGYELFGPGTENDFVSSSCTFEIDPNPFSVPVVPENPRVPLQRFN